VITRFHLAIIRTVLTPGHYPPWEQVACHRSYTRGRGVRIRSRRVRRFVSGNRKDRAMLRTGIQNSSSDPLSHEL